MRMREITSSGGTPSAEILLFPRPSGDRVLSGASPALLVLALRQGAAALRLTRDVLMQAAEPDSVPAIAVLAAGVAGLAASVEESAEASVQCIKDTMALLEWSVTRAEGAATSPRPGSAAEHPEASTAADLLDDLRIWLLTTSHATGPVTAARALASEGLRLSALALFVGAHLVGQSRELDAAAAMRPFDRTRGRTACDALHGIQERLSHLVRRIGAPEGGPLATNTFTERS